MPPKSKKNSNETPAEPAPEQTPPQDDNDDASESETPDVYTPDDIRTIVMENRRLQERVAALEARVQPKIPDDDDDDDSDDSDDSDYNGSDDPDSNDSDDGDETPESSKISKTSTTIRRRNRRARPHERVHEPKMTPPTKFSGKNSEFLGFMTHCEVTFQMCPRTYNSDKRKVMFVIMNLDGVPLRWAQDIFTDKKHPYRKNYKAFRKALFSVYDNHTYRQDAEDKLLALKQTKSASAYAVEFQTLAAALKYNDDALRGMFFKGLKGTVKTAIMQQGRATTFERLRDQAVHFDQHQHRMRVEEEKEKSPNTRSSNPSDGKKTITNNSGKSTNGPEPKRKKFNISKEEYERRKVLHLCFECGGEGHSANSNDCPKNKSRQGTSSAPPQKRYGEASNAMPPTPTPVIPANWQSQTHTRSEA